MRKRIKNFQYVLQQKSNIILFRKNITLKLDKPIITFTFDDFPLTAVENGGRILENYGKTGTYYVSFGLLGKDSPSGMIADHATIEKILSKGHDLGDHTYNHCKAESVANQVFEEQIVLNRENLEKNFPNFNFSSFSYPYGSVRPGVKKIVQKYYNLARGSYPGINKFVCDSSLLKSLRLYGKLEKQDVFKQLLEENKKYNGWVIFYTHDVSKNPSPYGCEEALFESVLNLALETGSEILNVAEVIKKLNSTFN